MKARDHLTPHHSFIYLWLVGALLVLGGLGYSYIASHPAGILDGQHEGDVRTTIAQFGTQIKTVSLSSPGLAEDIRKAYASYVAPELLAAWQSEPETAPGSALAAAGTDAWVDHIEVDAVTLSEDGTYAVEGRLMLMSRAGGVGSIPVFLAVSDLGGSFLISSYEENTQDSEPGESMSAASVSVIARLAEQAIAPGLSITPVSVAEDSRCPLDVQCVQAGTVSVRTLVMTASGEESVTFILGTPVPLGTKQVTLSSVTPETISTVPVEESAYRFTFTITSP